MISPDRIVGRANELQALGAFVEAALGAPSGVLLEGEAGAGKTTLFLAGVAAARERGARVLVARPAEAEGSLGLTGIADLLDGVIDEVLPRLPVPQADALKVALLLERPGPAAAHDRAVATAVGNALRALAREAPLIVAVDDLQWLDAASVGVLSFVWRRLHREPVGLLVTRRTGEGRAAFVDDDARVTRLPVGGLSLGAVRWLLESKLGLVLSRPALRRLHEVGGGNPFYALELGRAWQRRDIGSTPGEALPVPDSLRATVRDRIEGLPRATRQALPAVAALSVPTVRLLSSAVDADALAPAFEGPRAH